jgi:iron(III) transport system ATP-binding protein
VTERPTFPFSSSPGWGQRGTAGATIAASLAFDAIEHAYGEVEAVRGVTLTVQPGEIVCLLGPSGCGKSTLLRLAAGLERPSAGRVLIDKREVSSGSVMVPPERRGIGLVFQDFALFPHLTILHNVMYGLAAIPRRDAESAAAMALARVGLADYARDYPHTLSGGEQQRVALARAITPKPGILLMDEPFSGLDARLRDNVRDETLAVIRETRATCIVVTHDPEEAMRMADRIALMRAGRLVQLAAPEALYRAPVDLPTARFFSELNEVPGVVAAGAADSPLGRFAAPGLEEGAAAVVCVRPRGVHLGFDGEGVPGRLLRRRFLGEVDLLEIAVAGLDTPLIARARANEELRPGQDVQVSIDATDVLVFPRKSGAPVGS